MTFEAHNLHTTHKTGRSFLLWVRSFFAHGSSLLLMGDWLGRFLLTVEIWFGLSFVGKSVWSLLLMVPPVAAVKIAVISAARLQNEIAPKNVEYEK